MHSIKTFLRSAKHLIATTLRWGWLYGRVSYSQDGEDLFIVKFFNEKKDGFYVDVGAHHPYRYSNTYLLSQRGWTGINIDATPVSMAAFKQLRPQDINLELAIAAKAGECTYYMFQDSALNTLSEERAQEVLAHRQSQLKSKLAVQAFSLTEILQQHIPPKRSISFLNIDVEGADEAILQSNDWKKFRPKLLAIEVLFQGSIEELTRLPVCVFLRREGYQLIARFSNTAFFNLIND